MIESLGKASDAYLQCWFLTHYFMLGNNFGNMIQLAKYISLTLQGQESVTAFETVVGMSIDDFDDKVLHRYRIRYVNYNFDTSMLDHDFQRSEVADDKVSPMIEKYRDMYK